MYQDNPIIKKRFEEKMKRLDRTSLSILGSWALNCAVASMSELDKKKPDWFETVQARRNMFVEEYRSWMLDNMPVEIIIEDKSPAEAFQSKVNEIPPEDEINLEIDSALTIEPEI